MPCIWGESPCGFELHVALLCVLQNPKRLCFCLLISLLNTLSLQSSQVVLAVLAIGAFQLLFFQLEYFYPAPLLWLCSLLRCLLLRGPSQTTVSKVVPRIPSACVAYPIIYFLIYIIVLDISFWKTGVWEALFILSLELMRVPTMWSAYQ